MNFKGKRKLIAYLIFKSTRKRAKRQLGILRNKGKAVFDDDFKITEEEFLEE